MAFFFAYVFFFMIFSLVSDPMKLVLYNKHLVSVVDDDGLVL